MEESFPFLLSLFVFPTFQIAFDHSLIQFLSKFIEEIGTAIRLTMLHIHIDIVAVLYFHAEDFG